MNKKLKPCPVCETDRYVALVVGPKSLYRFVCAVCDAGKEGGKYNTEEKARKLWNELPRKEGNNKKMGVHRRRMGDRSR